VISRDPACKVIFRDLSSSAFSNRKAVEVQWSKPQEVPFPLSLDRVTFKSNPFTIFVSMDSIATPTSLEGEGYVSTLALFLVSASNSKESKSYLRLPAVWRDLWTEFAELKKQQEDEADRQTIRDLKRVVQENIGKFEDDVVLADNFRKRNGNARQVEAVERAQPAEGVMPSDDLIKLWLDKASSAAFQRMLLSRMTLPVWGYKQEILDTLAENQALIICSETGSGKSTQIPSFILENELLNGRRCKIFVTEPRRISAISLARRVSEELGERNNDVGTSRSLVGYAIRLESRVSQSTRLVYAYVEVLQVKRLITHVVYYRTTGVVVRMLERPGDFQDITHIVLDEVHERTIDSDFLLIILRRLLIQRPELKVILMSATVDAQRFSTYLGGAPVLNIPGRTFPVEVKFLEDAIDIANHRLDDRQPFSSLDDEDEGHSSDGARTDDLSRNIRSTLDGYSKQTRETVLKFDEYRLDYRLITKLLVRIATKPELSRYSRAILVFMPGLAEIRRLHDEIGADSAFNHGWVIHTLHSSIASEDQEKAFLVPPEGMRKIVIATNIAETGEGTFPVSYGVSSTDYNRYHNSGHYCGY
jgi:ATP-dependent RNA helicase DHX29